MGERLLVQRYFDGAKCIPTAINLRRVGWVAFTQGGGLNGLALGYSHAAPPGTFRGQIYDALMPYCAIKSGAERIYTLNVRHFQGLAPPEIASRIVTP